MSTRRGVLLGIAAYGLWGLFPIYFNLLDDASAVEILCHRIIWSLVLLLVALRLGSHRGGFADVLRDRGRLVRLALAAGCIATNWLVYVYAVGEGRVVEAALGYFVCPLVTVLIGVVALRERLRPLQWGSVALGAVAVTVLTATYGRPPWIALTLATTFAAYGYLKKDIDLPAVPSLAGETALLAPAAIAALLVLGADGATAFGASGVGVSLLLVGTGVVTVLPLACFTGAARRIPLSLLGLLQYVTPTTQFVIAVAVFRESMPPQRWVGFVLVWAALVLLSTDAVRRLRAERPTPQIVSPAGGG